VQLNRNRLIAGFVLLTVFGIITVVGISLFFLASQKESPPELNQRTPASDLNYCNASDARPCIVSFGFDSDENMLVNLLMPPSYPEFYLKITQKQSETRYECQRVKNFSTDFYCVGVQMPPGEPLQFMIISSKDDTILAEGNLSIIGLVYPTPGFALSTTIPLQTGTSLPFETPTQYQGQPTKTPTPTRYAPKPSSTTSPSYPNPSYPNPSYP